jgi:hypothetical protein
MEIKSEAKYMVIPKELIEKARDLGPKSVALYLGLLYFASLDKPVSCLTLQRLLGLTNEACNEGLNILVEHRFITYVNKSMLLHCEEDRRGVGKEEETIILPVVTTKFELEMQSLPEEEQAKTEIVTLKKNKLLEVMAFYKEKKSKEVEQIGEKNWNSIIFPRFVSVAKKLLILSNDDAEIAKKAIETIGSKFDKDGLNWSLWAIVKHFPKFASELKEDKFKGEYA